MGPRIGTYLIARGWLSTEELSRALEFQNESRLKLGKCLLELEYLSEQRLLTALSEQLKIPCIFAPIANVAQTALTSIPRSLCTQFRVVPFEYGQSRILGVAVDIDLNEEMILAVREVLGCAVQPYLTTREALQELLMRFVLPRPEDAKTMLDSTQVAEQVGRVFLEKWTHYRANRARFASLDNVIWLRYLSSDGSHDHLLFSENN